MAIDKSLSQAPLGLDQLDPEMMGDEPALEIEIEDPEAVEIGVDGKPILRIEKEDEEEEPFDQNLAEVLSEQVLQSLANDLIGDFDDDVGSRKD